MKQRKHETCSTEVFSATGYKEGKDGIVGIKLHMHYNSVSVFHMAFEITWHKSKRTLAATVKIVILADRVFTCSIS